MKPRRPWGLPIAKLSPLSWAPGEPSGLLQHTEHNEASPSLGAANCETVATVVGSWWAPAEWRHTLTRLGPRRPCGVRTAKLPQRSRVPGKPSGAVSCADQNEASPSLGGCELPNCRHVRGLLGGPTEPCHTQIRMKPRRPWGLRTAKMSPFRGLRESPAERLHTLIRMKHRRP